MESSSNITELYLDRIWINTVFSRTVAEGNYMKKRDNTSLNTLLYVTESLIKYPKSKSLNNRC